MLTQAMIEHVMCGDFIDEGASARIYKCEGYPGYIIKQQKRSARHISHPPLLQQRIQECARKATQQDNFKHLRVPWCQHVGSSPKSSMYLMEQIDVSEPVDLTLRIPEIFAKELIRFYFLAACSGYYPYDYEIYKQPDNTYALVDFDKFGLLLNKSFIEFPFKRTISLQEAGFWAPPGLLAIHNTEIPLNNITKDMRGDKGLASIPELPPNLAAELEDLEVCLHFPFDDEEKRQLQESFDKNLQRLIIYPKPPRARR